MLWAPVIAMAGVGAGIMIQDGALEQSRVATILEREAEARSKLNCKLEIRCGIYLVFFDRFGFVFVFD